MAATTTAREEVPEVATGPRLRFSFPGLAGATLFLCASLTPSLLPRGWLFQGVISGLLAAFGYGIGVLAVWLLNWVAGQRVVPQPNRTAWRALAVSSGVLIVVFAWLGSGWQRAIHRLIGLDPPHRGTYLLVLILAAVLFAALIGGARLLRRGTRAVVTWLGRYVSPPAARAIGVVVVALLIVGVANGVLLRGSYRLADRSFATINGETQPGVAAPTSSFRTGGPGSEASWASLGNQGRTFIGGGPTVADLRAFTGATPKEPIRVYAGLDSADTARERAELVVRELERTGGFNRAVLCLITTTGTGWVNAKGVDPLEYMYNGDTALVSMQYSYLPSAISFLVDQQRARDAGRALVDEVYGVWSRMPVGQRPKLLVFGESLGSFGSEAAFSGGGDIRNRVDGMLLVGPPYSNELWREFTRDREPGTTEVLPEYEQGRMIRFAADPAVDLARPSASTWAYPRVVYLQHPSDPITWWSPRLAVSRPDWLEEQRGGDVLPAMRWYPFVTWCQVTADMAGSNEVPAGHGHNFGAAPVVAWAEIAPPPNWTIERTSALTELIEE
ncbi:alpha/beta hydrolase [Actinoplanes solisilvae]|uniref:alpha/beta hydrolase n=1 Tax=Actinoplanes solisilvae TaxID=2486853 RepID=UPI000FD9E004|nr:alpha/beta-hydrolase family protein [Actinoplanes solisilvae]